METVVFPKRMSRTRNVLELEARCSISEKCRIVSAKNRRISSTSVLVDDVTVLTESLHSIYHGNAYAWRLDGVWRVRSSDDVPETEILIAPPLYRIIDGKGIVNYGSGQNPTHDMTPSFATFSCASWPRSVFLLVELSGGEMRKVSTEHSVDPSSDVGGGKKKVGEWLGR